MNQLTMFDEQHPLEVKKSFYNTIGATAKEKKVLDKKCQTQEEKILTKIAQFPDWEHYSPEYMLEYEILGNAPLTSYRRAFTNLEKQGKIIKVGKRMGNYGLQVNTYKLK